MIVLSSTLKLHREITRWLLCWLHFHHNDNAEFASKRKFYCERSFWCLLFIDKRSMNFKLSRKVIVIQVHLQIACFLLWLTLMMVEKSFNTYDQHFSMICEGNFRLVGFEFRTGVYSFSTKNKTKEKWSDGHQSVNWIDWKDYSSIWWFVVKDFLRSRSQNGFKIVLMFK